MRRRRNLAIIVLAVVLLAGAVLAVIFGLGGDIIGTAFRAGSQDHVAYLPVIRAAAKPVRPLLACVARNSDGSHTAVFSYESENEWEVIVPVGSENRFLPGPEDRGQPIAFQPGRAPSWPEGGYSVSFEGNELVWALYGSTAKASTSSPVCAYRVHIEMTWYDAAGNLLSGPPEDLPADFGITAQSEFGTAECVYPPGSSELACEYANQDPALDDDGLWVPDGASYTVAESGLPEGWRTYMGVGMFPSGGSSLHFTHLVDARATGTQ